jgi:hypothetical protein
MRHTECSERLTKRFARLTSGVRRTLQSVATDTLGQSTTSAGITVTLDSFPLQTTVLAPPNGATLSGTAILDASAIGNAVITSV